MKESVNAFDLLDMLRQQNGEEIQHFDHVSRYLSMKAREKGIPFSFQFELTPLCNFSCKMCYVHLNADQLKGQKILSVDTWKDLMHQAWEAGMMKAALTGGECLAYPGFDELFLYLHSLGCQVSVLTNGYLLDDRRIQFFREHMPCRIQVTLYGWNDDVYERVTGQRAFSTVAANIRKAVEAGLPITLSVTPNRYLGEDVFETIRVAYDLSRIVTINDFIISPREETGRAEQQDDLETDMYIRIYQFRNDLKGKENLGIAAEMLPPECGKDPDVPKRGIRCGGGRSACIITWDGVMVPCYQLMMIHDFPLQVGIQKAWDTVHAGAMNWPVYSGCDGCVYANVCRGKCAGCQLRFVSPGEKPKAFCEQTKRFVCSGVFRLPELECD